VAVRLRSDIVGEFRVAVKPEGGKLPEEPSGEPEEESYEAEASAEEVAQGQGQEAIQALEGTA
jgi:hypothetical protein